MIKATRDRSAKAFMEMGFKVTDSETNFLFVSHPDIPAEEIFTYTREKGIFIRYFKKPVIDKWLRITIGTDEQMDKLIAAVKECIESR